MACPGTNRETNPSIDELPLDTPESQAISANSRATSLESAVAFVGAMFGGGGNGDPAAVLEARMLQPLYVTFFLIAAAVTWLGVETHDLVERAQRRPVLSTGVLLLFLLSVVAMFSQAENPFLYFQF